MKYQTLTNSILISTLLASPVVLADSKTANKQAEAVTAEQKSTSNEAIKKLEKEQHALLEVFNKNVASGFEKVKEATRLIKQDGKEKEAIAALEAATGKFDIALAANPELNLVPIDTAVTITDLLATPDTIKESTDLAIDLLKDHKVQAARALLVTLEDEMVTETTYLPMAVYPDAIKLATKALVAGDKDEAATILKTALSTFVIKQSVIPLALVRAESFLKEAAELDKNKDKDKISDHLKAAEQQLEIATLLGYTDKKSKAYEDIKDQIKDLEKAVDTDNAVESLYKKLKTSFRNLIGEHSKQETVNQNAEDK